MNLILGVKTRRQLEQAASAAGGYIFYGQAGVGKRSAALVIAQRLNCQSKTSPGDDNCSRCTQIAAGSYPDLVLVEPGEEPSIGVAVVREVAQKLSTKPYYADSVRFLIIDQAELLTPAAQNALLKIIEEPPPRTRVILIALTLESLLSTVRSRLSAVYFPPVPTADITAWLVKTRGVKSPEAENIAKLAAGAPGLAAVLSADPAAVSQLRRRADQAAGLRGDSLFTRLKTARDLADDKADPFGLAVVVQEQVKSDLDCGIISPEAAANQLSAVAELRTMLNAGVNRRVALENFALGVNNA
jgi:DNA polymerase III delta' subunit